MKISKQARRDARELFRTCQVNGLLDEARLRQAITLLGTQKPRGFLEILTRLHRLVKLDREQHTAVVESALPLPAEEQAALKSRLTATHGNGIDVSFTQNPSLIGGLRIRVGSDLFDGSVKMRLEKLEQSF
jgi:F-type H+-transporting ATPase subunit delta